MELLGSPDRGETITVSHLRRVAYAPSVRRLARLSSESIDALVAEIARLAPAGHAAAQVLARLAHENGAGRSPLKFNQIQQDVQNLFAGLPEAAPGLPAAVLGAYRCLLRLAGIDPQTAFPQGAWQIYAAFGLRDDPAHYTCETDGFDSLLARGALTPSPVDRLAALLMAASDCLVNYQALLENAWRERVLPRLLYETSVLLADQPSFELLFREWEARNPPGSPNLVSGANFVPANGMSRQYARQRRLDFDQFMAETVRELPEAQRMEWLARVQTAEKNDLPVYLRQMNILSYFEPGLYGEIRHELPLATAKLGMVVRGVYYLLPALDEDGAPLGDPGLARALAASLLGPATPGAGLSALTSLARVRRAALPGLRALFSEDTLSSLDALRTAPLLINVGSPGGTGSLGRNNSAGQLSSTAGLPRAGSLSPGRRQLLGRTRLGERGLGDHPLTIIDSGSALVFDASASLFDPLLLCSLAEIFAMLTARAAMQLSETPVSAGPASRFAASFQPRQVAVRFQPHEAELIQNAPQSEPEASAEVDSVQLRPAVQLRALCKQHPELPQLAVNDLLLLYRAVHACTYRPAAGLIAEINDLQQAPNPTSRTGVLIARATRQTLEVLQNPPAGSPVMVVCYDVSARSPLERQRPLRLQVPVTDLNLINLHQRAVLALHANQDKPKASALLSNGTAEANGPVFSAGTEPRQDAAAPDFAAARADYLAALSAFGTVMRRLRESTMLGESPFLEDEPLPSEMAEVLSGLLRTLPEGDGTPYDLFGELQDGEELFFNLGMAAPRSSLTRFLAARDDHPRRGMVWGVITSASGVMHISLRDFRPHVAHLHAAGLRDVADRIAQDYLNAFARGFNRFVYDLTQIIRI